ncbi:hypothetical protein JCM14244_16690 [Venenivibrio stagnispumantis]|uniref:TIGR04255 family protein n=1 Tax=Venenivibrio stagnispumantis TaxID=407998 RepID=A0AA46AG28_9AQUI|nr:TIGR04255 family protein [Venenivibrio stagnispumantis]MCW4573543.1 TIGR04255 family protein [Venenivibrio stagnispumantis]SMP23649.1 TIGR04255 family protein [Venenivibrio stagnispumantis]
MYKLSKQPLVEVAFELYWGNKNKGDLYFDPNYRLIIGALYERIKEKFPEFETLPTVNIPIEALPSGSKIVQYRFWSKNRKWPVVQVGPNILTVNMNKEYEKWENFKPLVLKVVNNFFSIYPDKENLFIDNLALKYLDAFPFDFINDNVLEFLKKKLHVNIGIDFGEEERRNRFPENPISVECKLEYFLNEPKGLLGVHFFKGLIENKKESLFIESHVESLQMSNIEPNIESISNWLDKAHEMTDFIFSSIIRGELEEELR